MKKYIIVHNFSFNQKVFFLGVQTIVKENCQKKIKL